MPSSQEDNEALDKYALNMRLYSNMLELFSQRNKVLMSKYQGPFVEQILRHSQSNSTNYNILKTSRALYLKASRKM